MLVEHLADRARAVRFVPDRPSLEGLAAEETRSSHTVRGIPARMDSHVTDRP